MKVHCFSLFTLRVSLFGYLRVTILYLSLSITTTESLVQRIKELEAQVEELKLQQKYFVPDGKTVNTPPQFEPPFLAAQETVKEYFQHFETSPAEGSIRINGERYVLIRANALSYEFLKSIQELYADRGDQEAHRIARNMLFDFAHVIAKEDAGSFHKAMNLDDPISKLSAGPVHFAYTGWAFVDILPESNPSPDDNFFLKYHHPYSFEAHSWLEKGQQSEHPVCSMNAGYSSGWCEESFGIELTAVEISCKAKGDDHCTFIMAPPHRIKEYLDNESEETQKKDYHIPLFFERKRVEETIQNSLNEKIILLKEIHHRVKNNMQVVSSLLSIQSDLAQHPETKRELRESKNRIGAMALLHETLYASGDLGKINPDEYFHSIVDSLIASYTNDQQDIKANIKLAPGLKEFDMDFSIPCGLIINELVSNAIKYAFPEDKGEICVCMEPIDQKNVQLIVRDNGIGLPKDKINFEELDSLGLQLVQMLVEQLNGDLVIENTPGAEFKFRLELP